MEHKPKGFISYSRKDSETVDKLVAALKTKYDIWIDREAIQGGEQWRKRIVNAIDTSDIFVIVLSPASVASNNVRKELDIAETHKKPIVPAKIEPTDIPEEMEFQLTGIQIVDITENFDVGIKKLLDALKAVIATDQSRDTSGHEISAEKGDQPSQPQAQGVLSGITASPELDKRRTTLTRRKLIPLVGIIVTVAVMLGVVMLILSSYTPSASATTPVTSLAPVVARTLSVAQVNCSYRPEQQNARVPFDIAAGAVVYVSATWFDHFVEAEGYIVEIQGPHMSEHDLYEAVWCDPVPIGSEAATIAFTDIQEQCNRNKGENRCQTIVLTPTPSP